MLGIIFIIFAFTVGAMVMIFMSDRGYEFSAILVGTLITFIIFVIELWVIYNFH